MGDIVDLMDRLRALVDATSHEGEDCVLVDEGLELLASYLAIEDRSVRLAVKEMIEVVAKAGPVR